MTEIPKVRKNVTRAETNDQIRDATYAPTQPTSLVKVTTRIKAASRKTAKSRQTPRKKRRSYTPDPVRSRIIAKHVGGHSNREIAKEEGVDRDTVSRVLSQDDAVEMMKGYRLQVLAMVPQAINVYEHLLNSKDEKVRAAAATKILEGLQIFLKGSACPEPTTPAQDNDQRKHLILGQIMEMMLYKQQHFGISLPPMFDELKSVELQLGLRRS